jgi:lipoprotein NlpI
MISVKGQYFDGRHPLGLAAALIVSDRQASLTGERNSLQYQTETLRVSPRIGGADRFVSFPDGGQLQCNDSQVLDALPQESRAEGPVAWLEQRWAVALIGVALMLTLLTCGYVFGLPRLAEYAAARIPIAAERDLGTKALGWLDGNGWFAPTTLSGEEQEALRTGFAALVHGLPLEATYSLQFRASPRIGANALALPGGTIVITDAMVKVADSPEEIMAVLAHEIGHVELRHTLRQALQDSLVAAVVTTLAGDASPDAAVTGLPVVVAQAHYSRDFETQADDYAFGLLNRHDISPGHFADLLERLEKRSNASGTRATFLDSHPPTPERIRRARAADPCAGTAGTVDDRIAACTRAITSGKLSTDYLAKTFLNRGNVWKAKGDYERAIADYNEASGLNPQYALAFNNRGSAWEAKGEYERAIEDYNEAIRLSPQYGYAFDNRANAWIGKGDYERAMVDYNEAIRLNPHFARAFSNRGDAWTAKGEYERALEDYNEAIRLNPQYAYAFFGRGIAHYYLGHLDTAASDFGDSSRLDPKNAYLPIWLDLERSRSGKADLARSELQHATQSFTKGEWPEPVMELLSGQINSSALLKAAENLDAKKRRDQVCEAHFYLGEYQLLNNRPNEARALLQEAEQECPKTFVEYRAAVAELKRLTR